MRTIKEHVSQLETQGYTVLESCIDVKATQDAMREALAAYRAAEPMPWRGGGKWFGHLNYVPSPVSAVIREVATNGPISQVLDGALGKSYRVVGFGGNANLPGSIFQPAHSDGAEFIVMNIPLGTVTEQNGSTEVWPGTHQEKLTISQFNSVPRKSVRLNSSPGDVVIRYSNLWHRGTPNKSQEVRFMLGMIISQTYDKLPPITVSEGEQAQFSSFGLPVHSKVGSPFKTGFKPNYFGTNLKGNFLELTWMYAPGVFTALRRFMSRASS
jgi:hypothetical protein